MKFAQVGDKTLFYTAPADSKDGDEEGTKLKHVLFDMQEQSDRPWGWIVDFRNMSFRHYTDFRFNIGLLKYLTNDKQIRSIWVLYPNIWLRRTIAFMKQFHNSPILHMIEFIEGSNLEVLEHLIRLGLSEEMAIHLIQCKETSEI